MAWKEDFRHTFLGGRIFFISMQLVMLLLYCFKYPRNTALGNDSIYSQFSLKAPIIQGVYQGGPLWPNTRVVNLGSTTKLC